MNARIRRQFARGKRQIETRWARAPKSNQDDKPVLGRAHIRQDIGWRQRGVIPGEIGVFLGLAKECALVETIDRRLHLLDLHAPNRESDHVLNIASNAPYDGHYQNRLPMVVC